MEWLFLAIGVLLIFAGVADVFFTVLHPDGFGFLSSRLYGTLFHSMRFLVRPVPRRLRALVLSLAAPLMIPAVIAVWMFLVLTGYAFVYYAGMNGETFNFSSPGLGPSLGEALYASGISVSTLGYGDVTPTSGVYQALTVSEALVGFGILTLAVTYVVGIHGVLQHLGILAAGLLHQASDTAEPLSILEPHFPDGEPRDLDPHVMSFHRGLVELYEGLRRYPIVYYYHSRRPYRSLPYTFRMIGGVTSALRWGLPKDHPGSLSPWMPTLITGFDMVTSFLEERFLSERLGEAPGPVPFETFRAALEHGKEPSDPWLERFLEMQLFMRDLVRLEGPPDTEESYDRYKEWLPFAYRSRSFFEVSTSDLGYELHELERSPDKRQF
jgi:hypothetical protein